jgi:hypothetical protein
MKPHRGVMILVFGILSIVCCFAFGIAAWVMGNSDLAEIAAGQMDPAGRDLTQAGKICGIVGLVLNGLGLILWVALVGLGMVAGTLGH